MLLCTGGDANSRCYYRCALHVLQYVRQWDDGSGTSIRHCFHISIALRHGQLVKARKSVVASDRLINFSSYIFLRSKAPINIECSTFTYLHDSDDFGWVDECPDGVVNVVRALPM